MGFGCPICSEKLDKLPAEAQARAGNHASNEVNISATPCGHIFHAYCIQKWLSGNLASSKQCPCCRKDVPRLRCLSLFPTSYDESILDDSFSEPAPCNHGEIITSLKSQIMKLQSDTREKDQMYNLLSSDYSTLMDNYRTEKMTSDTWMMRAKQYESYRDLADEVEARAKRAENQLKTFTHLENGLKGVETAVNEELPNFPPTVESIRSLLEMKHVLSSELKNTSSKNSELRKNYESIRSDKMKLKVQYEKKNQEYKELKQIYEIARVNGRIGNASPATLGASNLLDASTPKAFRSKRRFQQEPLASTSSKNTIGSPGVDTDVDVFPTSFKPKKVKATKLGTVFSLSKKMDERNNEKITKLKFPCGLSPIIPSDNAPPPAHEKTSDATIVISSDSSMEQGGMDSDDDELRIRGNVPGAPLHLDPKRVKNLQHKSERPVLGLGKNTSTKKFTFRKPT